MVLWLERSLFQFSRPSDHEVGGSIPILFFFFFANKSCRYGDSKQLLVFGHLSKITKNPLNLGLKPPETTFLVWVRISPGQKYFFLLHSSMGMRGVTPPPPPPNPKRPPKTVSKPSKPGFKTSRNLTFSL